MKKRVLFIIAVVLFLFPLVSADLQISKLDKGSVIISELDNPAVYEFTINSPYSSENIEVYSLVGVTFSPRGTFELKNGENVFEVKAYPNQDIRKYSGPFVFEYQIKGENSGITKDTLTITIVSLEKTISLSPANFKPGDREVTLTIKNLQNANIENMEMEISSEFFETDHTISLAPYQSTNITLTINQDKAKKLSAGKYIISAKIKLGSATSRIDGILNYLEQQGTSIDTESEGILVKQTTITKTNEGNVKLIDTITTERDILTRLFTSYSIDPLSVERSGLSVKYAWQKEISPGESWVIVITTNYTFPVMLVLLIIALILFVQQYTKTNVKINKQVSYVKTKGGEFALKVRLMVKSNTHVDNVQIIDRLPGMTKLYEKYGSKPEKFDASTKRMFWNIGSLNAGEERTVSYIIYSKVKVVGRFELPPATAVFEKNNTPTESWSNRAYFISDGSE